MQILLTGTYNSLNKGDAAMELSTAAQLRSRGHQVRISTPEPDIDAALYGPGNVVHASRRVPRRAALNLLRAVVYRLTGSRTWLLGSDEELRATVDADLVVDLSGDMLTEDYGLRVALSHFHPIVLAWLVSTPYAIMAQSIGPFVWTKPIARFILKRALLITAREHRTVDHLAALGIADVSVTADTAFLLEADGADVASRAPNAVRIGLSLSSLAERHHGERNLLEDVTAALGSIAATEEIEILGIPHVTGPSSEKDDRVVLRELADGPLELDVLGDLSPEALKGTIGSCDLMIGARMHANIAALGSGVPVVALAYSHKFHGIMAEFGQAQFVLDLGSFDGAQLEVTLRRALEQRNQLASEIEEILPSVRRRALQNFDLLMQSAARAGVGA